MFKIFLCAISGSFIDGASIIPKTSKIITTAMLLFWW